MSLSRKQKKELKKLRSAASDIWDDQKDVFERAGKTLAKAGHHAADYGRSDVAPRVQDAYDTHLRPGLTSAAHTARKRIDKDIVPTLSSTFASALALLEVAKDPRVREAMKAAGKKGNELGAKVGIVPTKKSASPAKYIVIGFGVIAAVGVGYAAWQTLRADDELWVTDEAEIAPVGSSSTPPTA